MSELHTTIANTTTDSTAPGPDNDGNYNPSNPENHSRVAERSFNLPDDAEESLNKFFAEIDHSRVTTTNQALRVQAENRGINTVKRVVTTVAETGIPSVAGMLAKRFLDASGPASAFVAGAVVGASVGVTKTYKMNAVTGEGVKEFVQREYVGKDRNIEEGGFFRRNFSRISKAFNYLEYRAAGEGIDLGFMKIGGSRVKERALRIDTNLSALNIDLNNRNLFNDLSGRLKSGEVSDEQISTLLKDVYTQSKVSGFSERSTPEDMSRMLDAMNVLTYALVANGKQSLAERILRESNEDVKNITKSMRHSYVTVSTFSRAMKGLLFYEAAENIARLLSGQPASLNTPEIDGIRDDITDIETKIGDIDPKIDDLTDSINDLEDQIEDLAGTTEEVTRTVTKQVTDLDASSLTRLDDSILPDWLDGQEVYLDVRNGEVSQYGLSQGDSITPIFNSKQEVIGIARQNLAGTNALGEWFYDFFPEGTTVTSHSVIECTMQTYNLCEAAADATDTTPVRIFFGGRGNIERIMQVTPNGEQQLIGPLDMPDYQTTRDVVATITERIPADLTDINGDLLALNEELNDLLDKKVLLQQDIIDLQKKLLDLFSQIIGEEKWRIIRDVLTTQAGALLALFNFFAGLGRGTVWFGSEYRRPAKDNLLAPGENVAAGQSPSGENVAAGQSPSGENVAAGQSSYKYITKIERKIQRQKKKNFGSTKE